MPMTSDDYQPPFDSDFSTETVTADEQQRQELAEPFVGRWNLLVSTTNWEKGRIIHEWRVSLIEAGAAASDYSDEAWSRNVGGVTAPHVGRLRRVYDRFGSTFDSYEDLYWSHFLAAMDWDDAPLWLEGAARERWTVAEMRERRWQAHGAVESQRPGDSRIIDVDTDEDVVLSSPDPVLPAQGGRSAQTAGDPPTASVGKTYEDADFGDEDELVSLGPPDAGPAPAGLNASAPGGFSSDAAEGGLDSVPFQPFAGLPELPDDLADAIEGLKLALLRHKTGGWQAVSVETVRRYLEAMGQLVSEPEKPA